MLKFLLKGIFRDRHRWLFPLLIVSMGVLIMVFSLAFMEGYKDSFIRQNARFDTGHLKVVTRAYAELISQKPYDLALLDIDENLQLWKERYPQLEWHPRISFSALLDVPDASGDTAAQGEVSGMGVNLLSDSREIELLNLKKALVSGRLPSKPGELLLSKDAFQRLGIKSGNSITLIGSSVYGALTMQNFIVVGSVSFGVNALDRGAVIADLADIRSFLDMHGGATEILAFWRHGKFKTRDTMNLAQDFNEHFSHPEDEFSPQMLSLMEQNNLAYLIAVFSTSIGWMSAILVIIMGIVLWNSGLMNGIRRYGEFGIRLAIGESKGQVYGSLLAEALIIGIIGSALGTLMGLGITSWFSINGIDLAAYNRNSTILAENVVYPAVLWTSILAGLIPGVLAPLMGAALAGIAIHKRNTSQLFKELET